MNISFDITKDVRFQQGFKKGLEISEEMGMKRQAIFFIRNMLDYGLTNKLIAQIVHEKPYFVSKIKKQLKKEPEIISLLKEGKLKVAQIARELKVSPFLVEIIQKDKKDWAPFSKQKPRQHLLP